MTSQAKSTTLKAILLCVAVLVLALALLIPCVVVYKLAHGASAVRCAAILTAYALTGISSLFLVVRHRDRSKTWGILFGLCFYGLLFLSWRL